MVFSNDCEMCKAEVTSRCRGVACGNCGDWFHANCVGIDAGGYDVLGLDAIFWFCLKCIPDVRDLLKSMPASRGPPPAPSHNKTGARLKKTMSPKKKTMSSPSSPRTPNSECRTGTNKPIPSPRSKFLSSHLRTTHQDIRKQDNVKDSRKEGMKQKLKTPNPKLNVIGDSIVKYMGAPLESKTQLKTKVYCRPGKGIEAITDDVDKLKAHDNINIVSLGGNDIKNMGSCEIRDKYKTLLKQLKAKRMKCLITGIFPRPREGMEWHSRVLSFNTWLHKECLGMDMDFVNLWEPFIHRREMFCEDGVHFSRFGNEYTTDIIADFILEQVSKVKSFLA